MPQIRKLSGSYSKMAGDALKLSYYPVEEQVDSLKNVPYKENLNQILVDLKRNRFLPTNGHSVDDFIMDWVTSESTTYVQGNMTGSYFTTLLLSLFIRKSPRFVNADKGRTDDEECRFEKYHNGNIVKALVDFAYYDDKNQLCGVSISYSLIDPSLWTIAIIRNTNAKPEDREVVILTPEEMHEDETELLESNATPAAFLNALGSEQAKRLLTGVLQNDGIVSTSKLKKVSEYLSFVPETNKTLSAKKKQFETWIAKQKEVLEAVEKEYTDAKMIIEIDDSPDKEGRIAKLVEIHDIKKAIIEERFEPACRKAMAGALILSPNPTLDKAASQSLIRRNTGSVTTGLIAFALLLSFISILTGYGAPFGINLALNLVTYLSVTAAGTVVGSAVKATVNENNLVAYQEGEVARLSHTRTMEEAFVISAEEVEQRLNSFADVPVVEDALHEDDLNKANQELSEILQNSPALVKAETLIPSIPVDNHPTNLKAKSVESVVPNDTLNNMPTPKIEETFSGL